MGKPDFNKAMPVRLHSACLTADVFGSRRCDCGDQLRLAMARLDDLGGGIVLYLAQEGRGLGLANKMRTYRLQEDGLDTVDANTTLGFDDDERDYQVAARMLKMLNARESSCSPTTRPSSTASPKLALRLSAGCRSRPP